MNVAVTIMCVILSSIVCCFLGIGYVIDQYSQGEANDENNRADN
jgi:hypothetical protein